MLLEWDNFALVHKRNQAGSSRDNIGFLHLPSSHVVFLFLNAPLLTMHAIDRIGRVDYYGRSYTANDRQWKPREARKPHTSSRKRSAQTGNTHCPSTAPAGSILIKFWLNMRHFDNACLIDIREEDTSFHVTSAPIFP